MKCNSYSYGLPHLKKEKQKLNMNLRLIVIYRGL